MAKAGLSILKMALCQAGEIGSRNNPHLDAVWYCETVYHGKNHRHTTESGISHFRACVLRMFKEDGPYEIRDLEVKSIDKKEAKQVILFYYLVSEEVW